MITHIPFKAITANCFRLTSYFENGTQELQYGYCEDLGDGRGWTAGICGFTLEEAEYFTQYFTPADWQSEDFYLQWAKLARMPKFRKKQMEVASEVFGKPALHEHKRLGFIHEASLAILYDLFVQHGESEPSDPYFSDSATGIIAKCLHYPETQYFNQLLRIRKEVLKHSANPATREVWYESLDRIPPLMALNTTKHFPL
jgi:chitosanase